MRYLLFFTRDSQCNVSDRPFELRRTHAGVAFELFGELDVDGSGQSWEYLDSWAYKADGAWTYGGVNCTDGSTTTADSTCVYPVCGQ